MAIKFVGGMYVGTIKIATEMQRVRNNVERASAAEPSCAHKLFNWCFVLCLHTPTTHPVHAVITQHHEVHHTCHRRWKLKHPLQRI